MSLPRAKTLEKLRTKFRVSYIKRSFRRMSASICAAWFKGMQESFRSFAIGLSLSVVLLYLILVAQFKSFKDPLLIMLAIPMGFIGVLIVLPLTGTTLNVMSLMGVLMLVGISASNSISDRGFCASAGGTGKVSGRGHHYLMPGAFAANSDDFAGDHHRHGADGAEDWVRAASSMLRWRAPLLADLPRRWC